MKKVRNRDPPSSEQTTSPNSTATALARLAAARANVLPAPPWLGACPLCGGRRFWVVDGGHYWCRECILPPLAAVGVAEVDG